MQNRRGTIKTIDEDCLLKGLQRDEVLIRATDVNADRMPLRGNNCASNVDMIVIDRQSPTICTSFGDVSYNGRESWGPLMRERQAVPPWPWATHSLRFLISYIINPPFALSVWFREKSGFARHEPSLIIGICNGRRQRWTLHIYAVITYYLVACNMPVFGIEPTLRKDVEERKYVRNIFLSKSL